MRRRRNRQSAFKRDREEELRSLPQRALDPDPSAMHLDDLPCDGQPQPSADDSTFGVALVSFVASEKTVDELGRYAQPVVAKADAVVVSVEAARGLDVAAVCRVFDILAEEVRHH